MRQIKSADISRMYFTCSGLSLASIDLPPSFMPDIISENRSSRQYEETGQRFENEPVIIPEALLHHSPPHTFLSRTASTATAFIIKISKSRLVSDPATTLWHNNLKTCAVSFRPGFRYRNARNIKNISGQEQTQTGV